MIIPEVMKSDLCHKSERERAPLVPEQINANFFLGKTAERYSKYLAMIKWSSFKTNDSMQESDLRLLSRQQ